MMGPGVCACPRRRRQVADVSLPWTENAETRKSTVCDGVYGGAPLTSNHQQGRQVFRRDAERDQHTALAFNSNKFLARRKIYSKSVYSHFGHVSWTIEGHLPLQDCPMNSSWSARRQKKTDVPDNNVVEVLLDVTTPAIKRWGLVCERALNK